MGAKRYLGHIDGITLPYLARDSTVSANPHQPSPAGHAPYLPEYLDISPDASIGWVLSVATPRKPGNGVSLDGKRTARADV